MSGLPNTVKGTDSGGFVEEPIAVTGRNASALPPGTYGIVVDECQDGIFDANDTWIPDAFSVLSSDRLPNPLLEAQISLMKSSAKETSKRMGYAARTFATMNLVLDKMDKSARQNILDPGSFASAWFSYGLTAAFGKMTGGADAKRGALDALRSTADEFAGIAADPPDPAFQQVDAAQVDGPPSLLPADPDLRAAQQLVDETRIDGALAGAFLHALERYQGAQQVGNGPWGIAHLRDGARLAALLADRLHGQADSWDTFFTPGDAYGFNTTANQLGDVWNYELRRPNYFDPGERAVALGNLGLPADRLDGVLAYFDGFGGLGARLSVTDHQAIQDDVAAAYTDMADTFDQLATALAQSAADLAAAEPWTRADEVPVADAGGPYTTDPGVAVTLDASSSTGPAGFELAWDLNGDGAFDDATGATVTTSRFTVPGSTNLVAVRATNPANGFASVDHALVHVSGTVPAVTTASPRPHSAVIEVPGGSQAFSVTPATGTVQWFLDNDNASVGGGTSWTYAPADDEQGAHLVSAVVTGADGGRSLVEFTVQVIGQDGDGDRWTAAPGGLDCDDTDPDVNPGHAEVIGNGKDDDCNPATPDDGQPVTFGGGPVIVPQLAGVATTPQYVEEGQTLVGGSANIDWTHPAKTDPNAHFAIDVDWGDGTVQHSDFTGNPDKSAISVAALVHPHRYAQEGMHDIHVCIDSPGTSAPQRACVDKQVQVVNAAPAVNAEYLQSGDRTAIGSPAPDVAVPSADWGIDDFGTLAYQRNNATGIQLLADSDSAPGYGRFRVDYAYDGNYSRLDDDLVGMALQVEPPEPAADDARYLLIGFSNGASPGPQQTDCGSGSAPPVVPLSPGLYLWDVTGVPTEQELFDGLTLHVGDAPECNDTAGALRVDATRNTGPHPGWATRVPRTQQLLDGSYHYTLQPIEVDYQPDGLTVYVDGVPEITYAPPAGEVFPPTRNAALWDDSQSNVFYRAFEPEQHLTAVEGDVVTVTQPVVDGGDDALTGTVAFGDGRAATAATIVGDPSRPAGWYTASGDHAWYDNGTYRGQTCVNDGTDEGCYPYTIDVTNAPPAVDAGPDVDGGLVTIAPTFTDPGRGDTHTAVIDWGDGTSDAFDEAALAFDDGQGFLPSTTHRYAAAGTYTVTVTVVDDDGGSGTDELAATIGEPNPTPTALLSIAEDGDVVAGTDTRIGVGFTDDGGTHAVTVDLGDGMGPQPVADLQDLGDFGEATVTTNYPTAGTYPVQTCVQDEAGASDCVQGQVVVSGGSGGSGGLGRLRGRRPAANERLCSPRRPSTGA